MDTSIEQTASNEDSFLSKLQKIVSDTVEEEGLIINNLLHPPKEILSQGKKLSDKMARFGGSWKFIILFLAIIGIWIGYNVVVTGKKEFDPYPFILMNLLLSCVAALQAPVIMMSQNRHEEKDRMQSENDYLIKFESGSGYSWFASKNGSSPGRANQIAVRHSGKATFTA
jgi:uncharacterized membrane protein